MVSPHPYMVQLVPSGMWQSLIGRWIVEAPSDMGAGLHQKTKKQNTIDSNGVSFSLIKQTQMWPRRGTHSSSFNMTRLEPSGPQISREMRSLGCLDELLRCCRPTCTL